MISVLINVADVIQINPTPIFFSATETETWTSRNESNFARLENVLSLARVDLNSGWPGLLTKKVPKAIQKLPKFGAQRHFPLKSEVLDLF